MTVIDDDPVHPVTRWARLRDWLICRWCWDAVRGTGGSRTQALRTSARCAWPTRKQAT